MPLPHKDESPIKHILDKHGAKLSIHGGKATKFRELAEEIHRELEDKLETERHRTAVVQANLNAILNQYQVTSASLKQLQASQDRSAAKLRELQERNAQDGPAEDTDPHGE